MVATLRESNKRKIFRKVAELKHECKTIDGVTDLAVVKLKLQTWGESEAWIKGEAWSDWAERLVHSEDEETHYRSDPSDTDSPRFSFWYERHRGDWLKIEEGKLGKRVMVSDATAEHWKLWLAIRKDNIERLNALYEADRARADELARQFAARPHLSTTDQVMREAFGFTTAA